jgi:asparagine synthase (glutamine-hydrolysing)
MSAIAGIIHLKKEPVPFEHGRNIMKGLEKFPADDIQVWHKHNAFIGNHAQWITPESVGEQQPFYDSERQCVITADAIIDNREELFEKLQVERSKQKHIPDSQLILLAYYKWGEDSPKHLVGDFVYMIWDERNQILFGARDFSGSRTLYYYKDDERVAFCTTIMPLFTLPGVQKELNEEWMAEFLAIVGMVDVADSTITPFKTVMQVPPSHSILIFNGKTLLDQYCHLRRQQKIKLRSDHEYVEAFQEVFSKAVSNRLRTHKKVGAQLSGGLDSGSIVSFAAKELKEKKQQLYTFSYVPPKDFVDFTPPHLLTNETPLIKKTVQYVGGIKDHYCDFIDRDSYSEIDSFLEAMEMPYKFFENSFWLSGMFEKANEHDVGILLNGGRGNLTISWGTAIDYYAELLKKFKLFTLAIEIDRYSKKAGGNRLRRLPVIVKTAFPILKNTNNQYTVPNIINPSFSKKTKVFDRLKEYGMNESGWFETSNVFKQRRSHFEESFHWNASNTIASKLSLKHSLWKRDPTNDLRIVRYCLSLPEDQYVQNGLDRALIRRATKDYLPDEVRLNQRIRGVQGADWLHRIRPFWSGITQEVNGLINDDSLKNFIDPKILNELSMITKDAVLPEFAIKPMYKILMRVLIVSRFIKKFY